MKETITTAEKLEIHYPLREYQIEWIEKIYRAWDRGQRKVLAQLPTAAGKTVALAHISNDFFLAGRKILVLAHRLELVEQAADKLSAIIGAEVGIIKHGYPAHLTRKIQVGSVQTLSRRNLAQILPKIGLLICDEAHHATAKTYREIFNFYENVPILGVTATPKREDGQGFKELFDVLVEGIDTHSLIKTGYLSPYKLFVTSSSISTIGIKKSKSNNDYAKNDLALAVTTQVSLDNIFENWSKFAHRKKTLIFAASITHSKAIATYFQTRGVECEHLDAQTPEKERKAILNRFSAGITQIITNYQIVTEGYDCPNIECVYCLRPTTSSTLWLQMVGRSLRTAPNKKYATIIDLTENWKIHGLPDDNRQWLLSPLSLSESQYTPGLIKCPSCTHVFRDNTRSLKPLSLSINDDGKIVEKYQIPCPNCQATVLFERLESKRYQASLRLKSAVHPSISEIDLSVSPMRLREIYDLIIERRLRQKPSNEAYKNIFTNFIITIDEFTLGDWREIVKIVEPDVEVPSRNAWKLYLEGKRRHKNRIAALNHLKKRKQLEIAANTPTSPKKSELASNLNPSTAKLGDRNLLKIYEKEWWDSLAELPIELQEFLCDNGGLFFVDLLPRIGQISLEVKLDPILRKFKQKEVEIAFGKGFNKPVHLMFRLATSDND